MRRKGESMRRTERTSSPNMLEARLDYKYMKTRNNELSKEIAVLRKNLTQKQSDIDYLLKEKFNIEFRYNQLYNLFSNIEKRGKTTLNHIVECSNELMQIMKITNRVRNSGNILLDSPLETSKAKDSSFKQVVTPHAVNGHIIHTPTIRIARYSEPTTEPGPSSTVCDAVNEDCEENTSNSEEEEVLENDVVENDEDYSDVDDPGNGTFESKSTIVSSVHSDLDCLEDDGPGSNSDEDTPTITNENLSTIQEEMEAFFEQQTELEEDQPVFSDRSQEVRIYLNQLSEKSSGVNNDRRSRNSSFKYLDGLDRTISSVVPEASTSYDTTTRFNDSQVLNDEVNFVTLTPKRKSLVERKSIGSPIPSKISRRNIIPKRRFSGEISVSSPSKASYTSPQRSKDISRSVSSSFAEMNKSSENTLKNRTSLRSMDTIGNSVTDANSKSFLVPTFNSFIERTSIGSTPSFATNQFSSMDHSVTPVTAKVNIRQNRKKPGAVPVVQLTRLELSEEVTQHQCLRSMKLSNSSKKSEGSGEELLTNQQIKRDKSDVKKRKLERKTPSPSSPKKVVVSKVKRERPPEKTDAAIVCQRPKRAAKPTTLKEASLNKKMRRSR